MGPLIKNVVISYFALQQKDRTLSLNMRLPQMKSNASWSTLLYKLQNQEIQQVPFENYYFKISHKSIKRLANVLRSLKAYLINIRNSTLVFTYN